VTRTCNANLLNQCRLACAFFRLLVSRDLPSLCWCLTCSP